jgi:threonine aldolase
MVSLEPGWQFASDNTAGVCPEAWAALAAANAGNEPSYGADSWTARACELLRALFEHSTAQVFFVFNGTAANALALAALCRGYHSIVCHETSHLHSDECGAPEFFSHGAKLLLVPGADGKLDPTGVATVVGQGRELHFPPPRALSVSQTTEWGTVYGPQQLAALSALAHAHGLAVHMDGARFANALAAHVEHGVSAADLSWRAGIDVLSLGGTKNGLNTTEAVVFFSPELAREFEYRVKQGGQLASKMRFQSSQWVGVLASGAWLGAARHANAMAQHLATALARVPRLRLCRPVEANAVFIELEPAHAQAMADAGWHFYRMGGAGYRLMCSWSTTGAQIERLAADFQRTCPGP